MKSVVFAAMSLLALTGCANRYDITTVDGQKYTTSTAPDFSVGRYNFKDTTGVDRSISLVNVKSVSRL